MVVFGQSGYIRAKLVVFVQECFLSGKSCSILAKVVKFGQKLLYSVKLVLFG